MEVCEAPSGAARHPLKTPTWVVQRLIALCLEHPAWGCAKLARQLQTEGAYVSSPTIQKILIEHKLGRREQRATILAHKVVDEGATPNAEQTREIVRFDPWFQARLSAPVLPRELLVQDCVLISRSANCSLRVQLVVDSYSHRCHARVHIGNAAASAVEMLQNWVLKDYTALACPVRAILTSAAPQYCGSARHPFALFLAAQGIRHQHVRATSARDMPATFLRARRLLQSGFLAKYKGLECADPTSLQHELDQWLHRYHHARIRDDPRVAGLRPMDLLPKPVETSSAMR